MAAIRNVGIISHIDAGKTTTTERLLYYTGRTHRIGEVDDGEATTDWMSQEQERGISITAATTTCFWADHQINIIDTPGHVDFTAEVERSLRVLDGAVAIFSAVEGVEPQSETVWHQADRYEVARLAFINKMDRAGASFESVLEQIRERLHAIPVALQVPLGAEQGFRGIIDVVTLEEVTWNADGTDQSRRVIEPSDPRVSGWRERLIDALADVSDEIADLFLSERDIPPQLIRDGVRSAVLSRRLVPLFCGAARRNIGIQPLLDAIVWYLPSPGELPPLRLLPRPGASAELAHVERSHDGEPVALAFKIQNDGESGPLCFVRIYSGSLSRGDRVFNRSTDRKERVQRLLRMHANRREQIDAAQAGDIAAVVGLKFTRTGDTLALDGEGGLLEPIRFPSPVMSIAVEARSASDSAALIAALDQLRLEDPTFTAAENEDTGQLLVSGMGELHLEVLLRQVTERTGLTANVGKPQVSFRECVSGAAEHTEVFERQIGARPHYAEVGLRVAPGERGTGCQFETAGAALPDEYLVAVRRGVEGAFSSGPGYGYPLVDIRVELCDWASDEERSSAFAFEAAAAAGLDATVRKAGPILLEPVMAVDVTTPQEFLGEILGNLRARGGAIQSVESGPTAERISASVPLSAMFGSTTDLRSTSQGRAAYTMSFAHYQQAR